MCAERAGGCAALRLSLAACAGELRNALLAGDGKSGTRLRPAVAGLRRAGRHSSGEVRGESGQLRSLASFLAGLCRGVTDALPAGDGKWGQAHCPRRINEPVPIFLGSLREAEVKGWNRSADTFVENLKRNS